MQGVWLENRHLDLRADLPEPQPAAGEVVVRVVRAGICNTDLELLRGYYPYTGVPGHEFVGRVESGPDDWVGRRVVGEINASCGTCDACRNGRRNHCPQRTVLGIVRRHGAFAERLCLPLDNLHVVPEELSDDVATFVEPLAAALEIQQQIDVLPEHHVLVVGDGKLGLLIAQSLAITGCRLEVLGRHEHKLRILQERGIRAGTTGSIQPKNVDIAVECTGNPQGFALALQALRPRGTLVLKSTYAGDLQMDAAAVVVNEIRLVGSRCGPFEPALSLLTEGRVDVTPLVEASYPLSHALDAFDRARRPGSLKVLLQMP